MADAPKTAKLKLQLDLEIHPRKGQSLDEATDEMAKLMADYLTRADGTLMSDYGAGLKEIEEFQENDGESPVWGGYEGPFIVSASLTPAPSMRERD